MNPTHLEVKKQDVQYVVSINYAMYQGCFIWRGIMARYLSQYCPSKFVAANVPVNIVPVICRGKCPNKLFAPAIKCCGKNELPGQLPRQFSVPRKLPGHFLGHSGELCGSEITGLLRMIVYNYNI